MAEKVMQSHLTKTLKDGAIYEKDAEERSLRAKPPSTTSIVVSYYFVRLYVGVTFTHIMCVYVYVCKFICVCAHVWVCALRSYTDKWEILRSSGFLSSCRLVVPAAA